MEQSERRPHLDGLRKRMSADSQPALRALTASAQVGHAPECRRGLQGWGELRAGAGACAPETGFHPSTHKNRHKKEVERLGGAEKDSVVLSEAVASETQW